MPSLVCTINLDAKTKPHTDTQALDLGEMIEREWRHETSDVTIELLLR